MLVCMCARLCSGAASRGEREDFKGALITDVLSGLDSHRRRYGASQAVDVGEPEEAPNRVHQLTIEESIGPESWSWPM